MKHLDMAGKPCPIPVVQARGALRGGEDGVRVDVDNEVAVQNLKKMADGEGYAFSCERAGESLWRVTLRADGADVAYDAPVMTAAKSASANSGTLLLIGRERMGEGDPELGSMLMKGFLFAQTELAEPPSDVIFLNGGAKLAVTGAPTVPDLLALESKGARVWVCGTCANFFGIADKLGAGRITDMMHIARMLAEAGRVVTL